MLKNTKFSALVAGLLLASFSGGVRCSGVEKSADKFQKKFADLTTRKGELSDLCVLLLKGVGRVGKKIAGEDGSVDKFLETMDEKIGELEAKHAASKDGIKAIKETNDIQLNKIAYCIHQLENGKFIAGKEMSLANINAINLTKINEIRIGGFGYFGGNVEFAKRYYGGGLDIGVNFGSGGYTKSKIASVMIKPYFVTHVLEKLFVRGGLTLRLEFGGGIDALKGDGKNAKGNDAAGSTNSGGGQNAKKNSSVNLGVGFNVGVGYEITKNFSAFVLSDVVFSHNKLTKRMKHLDIFVGAGVSARYAHSSGLKAGGSVAGGLGVKKLSSGQAKATKAGK